MSSWCPPLFDDSPKRQTKRLFLYASDEIAGSLRQKYGTEEYVTADYDYMSHMAWLIGAASAAQALIRETGGVRGAWGQGDEQKTFSLIKVCTPHVISVWYGSIDQSPRPAGDGRRVEYEKAARSMLSVVNKFLPAGPSGAATDTAQDVRDAANMDRQWNSETAGGGAPLAYAGLLLSRALLACGQRCVEWSRVTFPVKSIRELLDSNAILDPRPLAGKQDLRRVIDCLEQAIQSVRRYYVMNMEGKVQPSGGA